MKLGLDIGTYSIKLVEIENGKIVSKKNVIHRGKIKDTIIDLLKEKDTSE